MFPVSIYTRAVRTVGRSHWPTSWMHSSQEAARWSYWPGRYSTANTASPPSGRLLKVTSTWGSENTTGRQRWYSSSVTPSTS